MIEPAIMVILNRGAGHSNEEIQVRISSFFQARGIAARMFVARNGGEIARLVAEAARGDAEVIVAAGGDGTIDAIAAELASTKKILAVLPLGTFNLLAKRLGISRDLETALQTAVNGRVAEINVGEVNGRVFLSRSSIGLYPLALRHREKMFRRFGRSRLIALLSGASALARWGSVMGISLTTESGKRLLRTRFVFVCNNPAELDYFKLPGRECIDDNKLSVYAARPLTPPGLLRLGFRMLRRKAEESRDFDTVCSREMRFEIDPPLVPVSLDGEVEIMQSPLVYRLRLGALRIRVPAAS